MNLQKDFEKGGLSEKREERNPVEKKELSICPRLRFLFIKYLLQSPRLQWRSFNCLNKAAKNDIASWRCSHTHTL